MSDSSTEPTVPRKPSTEVMTPEDSENTLKPYDDHGTDTNHLILAYYKQVYKNSGFSNGERQIVLGTEVDYMEWWWSDEDKKWRNHYGLFTNEEFEVFRKEDKEARAATM